MKVSVFADYYSSYLKENYVCATVLQQINSSSSSFIRYL